MATLGRRHGIATVGAVRLRGILGWWVARGYHLLALPFPPAARACSRTGPPRPASAATSWSSRHEVAATSCSLFGAAYLLYNAGRGLTSGEMELALANASWVIDAQGGPASSARCRTRSAASG